MESIPSGSESRWNTFRHELLASVPAEWQTYAELDGNRHVREFTQTRDGIREHPILYRCASPLQFGATHRPCLFEFDSILA
jgi:hypothetical protein